MLESMDRRPVGARAGATILRVVVAAGMLTLAGLAATGCIQDAVVEPVATVTGRIVPTGIEPASVTTSPTSTVITINTTVPTVGVRINMVGSGTLVSLINPIFPLPGSPEAAFASVTGGYNLKTRQLGRRRMVARGINFDLAWGDVDIRDFNTTVTSLNLDSVTIPPNDPLRTDNVQNLVVKPAGRAVFVLFAEDFTIDGKPVRTVRVLIDDFKNTGAGTPLFDDGAGFDPANPALSGDLNAGDGIFTRVVTGLAPEQHLYGFVVNNDDQIRRDPYEESSEFDGRGIRRSQILVK
jgi:hypothetical protein